MAKLIPASEYDVERNWLQLGVTFIPHITIVIKKTNGATELMYRAVLDRGEYYSPRSARAAADALVIDAVYDNGEIVFKPVAP